MRANSKTLPVIVIAVVLLGAAVLGYVKSDDTPKMPVRILFKNNGGKVIFSHLVHHRDYQIDCAQCHHDRKPMPHGKDDETMACGSCHPTEFDDDYMAAHMDSFPDETYCVRCHHTEYGEVIFDHEAHKDYASDCYDCHHGKEIEPEPQKCANCHKDDDSGELLSMRLAGHQSCANCHDDMFEKGLSSCKSCHVPVDMTQYEGDYTSCDKCHDSEVRELVLPRMNAFHDQCMSCHEGMDAGPYGPDNCKKCHISR
ncbi:cytochrome c3 family protein [Pseudodesulfovibrio tunisiensis]|uniref:cytochrome c3 family protein n=1 Tax=Pseudodesulfovibrio tunisiensis TaxID=463192 RepID=UPI001FB3704B|nr:cytochrome c3 family protein [Pseudodesulfovibrio tunisiensis]